MRALLVSLAAAGFLAAGPALAAQQTEGTVESVNPVAGTLALNTGEHFVFPNGWMLRGIVPGEVVGVTFNDDGQGIRAFDPHAGPDRRDSF